LKQPPQASVWIIDRSPRNLETTLPANLLNRQFRRLSLSQGYH
jgi:hypothetical protein